MAASTDGLLAGKVALVTGGARGQGAAEGRLFAAEGAAVILTDVLDQDGEATAAQILGATYHHHDVTKEADWEAVIAAIRSAHGRLDVLVNNAGIYHESKLVETELADWDRQIAVNQTGVLLGMQAGARLMIDAGNGGSIINISSVAGLMGSSRAIAYGASKWAVRGMTKIAAKELGRHGIRVNSIHPGMIDTDMLALTAIGRSPDKAVKAVPLGHFGTADDIAKVALFLASDESSYTSGQEFTVDEGVHS